ncbi:hypothetical protein AWB71_06007 [Caballeronia peredens]|nr:hypothetical protein AWB71_06007 [Caballeronia peredens]
MLDILRRAIALLAFVSSLAVAQEDCSRFVVLDEYSSSSDYAAYERVKTATCQETVSNVQSARSESVKFGIPIPVADDVFDMSFDGKSSSSDWNYWKQHFCTSNFYESQTKLANRNLSKVFSDNALAAVKACLAADAPYGYFQINKTGDRFFFHFKTGTKETLTKATLSPGVASAECPADNPFNLSAKERWFGYDFSGTPLEHNCPWNGDAGAMNLKLKNAGTRSIPLEKLVKVTVPLPPPPPAPATFSFYYTTNNNMHGPYETAAPSPYEKWNCVQSRKFGGWRAGFGEARGSRTCPDMHLSGDHTKYETGEYDRPNEYWDNEGICSYVFDCTAR